MEEADGARKCKAEMDAYADHGRVGWNCGLLAFFQGREKRCEIRERKIGACRMYVRIVPRERIRVRPI